MTANTLPLDLAAALEKASETGEKIALYPRQSETILREARYDHVTENHRHTKTVDRLLAEMEAGEWIGDLSEIQIAKFPTGKLVVLNGHNRLNAIAQQENPIETRVRLVELADDAEFRSRFARYDTATTLRGFGLQASVLGLPHQQHMFGIGGKGSKGAGSAGAPISAAFICHSYFGERERPLGTIDNWRAIHATYNPHIEALTAAVEPLRNTAGSRWILSKLDTSIVLAVFIAAHITDSVAAEATACNLLRSEPSIARENVWAPLDRAHHSERYDVKQNALRELPRRVALALNAERAGKKFRNQKKVGAIQIYDGRFTYRTETALRAWKSRRNSGGK